MTHNTTLPDIANEIETLTATLSKIKDLVALIGKPAILRADEVAKALDDAKERYAEALTNQATVEREDRLKAFTDIRIVATPGHNLLNTAFTSIIPVRLGTMTPRSLSPRRLSAGGLLDWTMPHTSTS